MGAWRGAALVLVVGVTLAAHPAIASTAAAPAPTIATAIGTVVSANWSGYMVNAGPRSSTYRAIRGAFIQPAVSRGCQPESDLLTWVGIGGFNQRAKNRTLIQIGTDADYDIMSGTSYWAWYQYLRTDLRGNQLGGSEKTKLPIRIRPGDAIVVATSVQPGAGTAAFEVRNLTTGHRASTVQNVPRGFHDGSSAEFVSERTGGLRLARFGVTAWTDASVQRTDGGWHALGTEAGLTEIRMTSGIRILADPDPMRSATGFTNRWKGCH